MAETNVGGISWVVDADVSPAVNSTKQLDAQVNKVEAGFKGMDTQVKKSSSAVKTAMGGMGRTAGAAGIQIQQLVGQLQGGQSAMLALSQQGADLGIVLGVPLLGAIVGIGASLAGMLIPDLVETETAMEKVQKVTEQVTAALTLSADGVANYGDHLKILSSISTELLDIRLRNLKAIQAEAVALSAQGINQTVDQYRGLNFEVDLFGKRTNEGARAFINLSAEAKKFAAVPTEENMNAYVGALQQFEMAGGNATKAGRELIADSASLIGQWSQGRATVDELTKSLLDNTRVTTDWGAETKRAAKEAYDEAVAIQEGMDKLREQAEKDKKQRAKKEEKADDFATGIISRGEGSPELARLEEERVKLEEYRAEGLISAQTYEDALTQIQQDGADARTAITQNALGTFSGAFDTMADVMADAKGEQSSAYKAMFALSKGFAIAQASLNLVTSISQASTLPWPANLGAMAAAAASGAQLVSQVSSAVYGGRENGGSVLGGKTYEVGEKNKPEMLMIPGNNGKVFSNQEMKSMMGGGGGNGSYQPPVINNYAAGVSVEHSRDSVTKQDVFAIVNAESMNPNSKMRRNFTSGTSVKNQIRGGRS